MKKKPHQWTKGEVRAVCKLWNDSTVDEIAAKLKVDPQQVIYIANQMRKAGFKLPKKHRRGTVHSMLKEVLAELS